MVMTESAPDRILAALQGGDQSAAERIVTHYGDRAYRLAIGITSNKQDAEEAVQDAFWSVIRNIGTFREDSPSDRGSTGSSSTPPIRSCAAAHADATTSRSTRCCPHSTNMGKTRTP